MATRATTTTDTKPIWIGGAKLRQRWDMSESCHRDRMKKGLIPKPEFPFGPNRPYWRMSVIEAFEQRDYSAAQEAA